ncbi:MAG: hypothetical protein U0470_01740 [Anaerolineae bacterium]
MTAALRSRPARAFERSADVIATATCTKSTGLRPTAACPAGTHGALHPRHRAGGRDWSYRLVDVDAPTGLR